MPCMRGLLLPKTKLTPLKNDVSFRNKVMRIGSLNFTERNRRASSPVQPVWIRSSA